MGDNFMPTLKKAARVVKAANVRTNSVISSSLLKNQVLKAEEVARQILHEARMSAAEIINSAEQSAASKK